MLNNTDTSRHSDNNDCYWPSGKEISRLSWTSAVDVLARMGANVDSLHGKRLSDLRTLVQQLKTESHANADCQCPAAEYIRAGGGAGKAKS